MGVYSKIFAASAAFVLSSVSVYFIHLFRKRYKRLEKHTSRRAVEAFDYLDINIVTGKENCDDVVHELRTRSLNDKALGFDCEWVTSRGGRQPVSLLQLSSSDGYCGLFRLSSFTNGNIPNSLKDLLQCEDIYKIGVAPNGDAKFIANDYQISIQGTIDVRHLVEMAGYNAGGLAAMTDSLLNVALDKRWKTRCSNWDDIELTSTQIHYAASDAHAAILIFVSMMNKINKQKNGYVWSSQSSDDVLDRTEEICWEYSNRNYKAKQNGKAVQGSSKKEKKAQEKESKKIFRSYATRTKPVYHNCYLQAPDGELLCTCDNKKALWYIEKGLAVLIREDPLIVRLCFEPAGRSTGDVAKFYQMEKENHCVVCGTNSYNRKNVVPREYRKFFPEIMKDHSSHDVLLLCTPCHQRSNVQDQARRRQLAAACHAPLAHDNPRVYEDASYRKLRMAARALLVHQQKLTLPAERRKRLEAIVLAHFPGQEELTISMVQQASTMKNTITNTDFAKESHGYKVVAKYLTLEGGLLRLEEEWRKHFLDTMNPKHLPALWSINHNRDRLKLKWDENRLDEKDLKSMGVEWQRN